MNPSELLRLAKAKLGGSPRFECPVCWVFWSLKDTCTRDQITDAMDFLRRSHGIGMIPIWSKGKTREEIEAGFDKAIALAEVEGHKVEEWV